MNFFNILSFTLFPFLLNSIVSISSLKISQNLVEKLKHENASADIFVLFKESTSRTIQMIQIDHLKFKTNGEKINAIVSTLQAQAKEAQKHVGELLRKNSQEFASLWISNEIYIENANSATIEMLSNFEEIEGIGEKEIWTTNSPLEGNADAPRSRQYNPFRFPGSWNRPWQVPQRPYFICYNPQWPYQPYPCHFPWKPEITTTTTTTTTTTPTPSTPTLTSTTTATPITTTPTTTMTETSITTPPTTTTTETPTIMQRNLPWGLKSINAEKAWEKGITGKGVHVSIFDSGVSYTHEQLIDNYLGGREGWFDPANPMSMTPYDKTGHGTFVAEIIAGKTIGVAPGVKWSACKMCDAYCSSLHFKLCFENFICPDKPNCEKSPQVINYSWGILNADPANDEAFNRVIITLNGAGIISVFSSGNYGEFGCSTMTLQSQHPGVISVGSIDEDFAVSDFSSRGPARDRIIKPDVVAPGRNIISASHLNDGKYEKGNGTSFASPHVAGIAALIKSKHPDWKFRQVKEAIVKGCEPAVPLTLNNTCGGKIDTVYPNNHAGYGKVNALRSIEF